MSVFLSLSPFPTTTTTTAAAEAPEAITLPGAPANSQRLFGELPDPHGAVYPQHQGCGGEQEPTQSITGIPSAPTPVLFIETQVCFGY